MNTSISVNRSMAGKSLMGVDGLKSSIAMSMERAPLAGLDFSKIRKDFATLNNRSECTVQRLILQLAYTRRLLPFPLFPRYDPVGLNVALPYSTLSSSDLFAHFFCLVHQRRAC